MAITLKEARPVRGGQAIAERPDGSHVSFMAYPTPLFDDDGRLIGAVNVLVDITELRRAEQATRAAADALEASNAVKDQFLGLVSHELRTPVTTIFGNARLLQSRGGGARRRRPRGDDRGHRDRCRPAPRDHREPAASDPAGLGDGARPGAAGPRSGSSSVRGLVPVAHPDRTIEVVGTPRSSSTRTRPISACCSRTCSRNAVKYSPPDTLIEVRLTDARRRDRGRGPRSRDRHRRGRRRPAVRALLPDRDGARRGDRARDRAGAVPADRHRARRPDLGDAPRGWWRGGRVRAADRRRGRRPPLRTTRPVRWRPARPASSPGCSGACPNRIGSARTRRPRWRPSVPRPPGGAFPTGSATCRPVRARGSRRRP